jgi:hypothetical protein
VPPPFSLNFVMRFSSILFACVAIRSTHGSMPDQQTLRASFQCQEDVYLLQFFMDAVAKAPTASGNDLLRSFPPESVERMRQLLNEGAAGIEARMRNLGLNLKRYGKDASFLATALGSLQYAFFNAERHRARSVSPHGQPVLNLETFDLMESFLSNDPCYSVTDITGKCQIKLRQAHMKKFDEGLVKIVCQWFVLGYPQFAGQARPYATTEHLSFLLDHNQMERYFSTTATACRQFEDMKRREAEYSLSEIESKHQHK